MSKFTSNYAVDLLIRGLDENPDLNKIVYYAISDQYSGAATALSGSLSDVPVVRETIKNAGVVKIDHSIKNELVDTVINVLDPEVKANNINRRVRSLIDDVLNFASQKDGSNDILSMFQNVIPVEVTAEHPDTDWDSVLYWILVRSVLVPIVKIPLDKNGKPIIIQDTKKESTSKKTTTFGKRVARMGEEPQKEKKEEPESKETLSGPIVDKPEEKETPEPNFIMVDVPNHEQVFEPESNALVVAVKPNEGRTKKAAAKTFKPATDEPIQKNMVGWMRGLTRTEYESVKQNMVSVIQKSMPSVEMPTVKDIFSTASYLDKFYALKVIVKKNRILGMYDNCPLTYKNIAMEIINDELHDDMEKALNTHSTIEPDISDDAIHCRIVSVIVAVELKDGDLVSSMLDKIYQSTATITEDTLSRFVLDYFKDRNLDLEKYESKGVFCNIETIVA